MSFFNFLIHLYFNLLRTSTRSDSKDFSTLTFYKLNRHSDADRNLLLRSSLQTDPESILRQAQHDIFRMTFVYKKHSNGSRMILLNRHSRPRFHEDKLQRESFEEEFKVAL